MIGRGRGIRAVLLAAILAGGHPPQSGAQEYGSSPLETPSTFPDDGLPTTRPEFVVWLTANAANVPPDRQAAVREHLYALISANTKARAAVGFPVFPAEPDTSLAQLFLWADRLGVFGAYRVARALDPALRSIKPVNLVDTAFQIQLDSAHFTLQSKRLGWSVRFPYYFMLSSVGRQRIRSQPEGDVVVLSTLFAPNAPEIGGASQATIMVVAGHTDDAAAFRSFWLRALRLSAGQQQTDTLLPGGTTYRGFDQQHKLKMEAVAVPIPDGALLVAYVGLEGTFQSNRQHFLDFLRAMRIPKPQ